MTYQNKPARLINKQPTYVEGHHCTKHDDPKHVSTQELRVQDVLRNLDKLFWSTEEIEGMTDTTYEKESVNKRVRFVRTERTAMRNPIFLACWGYWQPIKHYTKDKKGNRVVIADGMKRIPKAQAEYRAQEEGLRPTLNSNLYHANMDHLRSMKEHTLSLKEAGYNSTFSVNCMDQETETNPSSSDDFHELLDIAHQHTEIQTDKACVNVMKYEYRLEAFQRVLDYIEGTTCPRVLKTLRSELRSAIIGHDENKNKDKRKTSFFNRSYKTWNEKEEGVILRWYHGLPCPVGHELHFLNTSDTLGYGEPGTDDMVALHNECTIRVNSLYTARNRNHQPLGELLFKDEQEGQPSEDVYHASNNGNITYGVQSYDDVGDLNTNMIYDLLG